MSKSGESVRLVQRSKRLCFLEYKENVPENEVDTKGAPNTLKIRRGHRKFKKYGVRSNYHLRSRTILEELIKFKGKNLVEYEKKEKKKCKYHKAYLGGHNSPSEVFDTPLDSEGDTNPKGDYYPLSLVPF